MPTALQPIIERNPERDAELDFEIGFGIEDEPQLDWSAFLKRDLFLPDRNCDRLFTDKTVLITGAGGSIGSCLARMLAAHISKTSGIARSFPPKAACLA